MNTTSANLNSAAAINALTERANAAIDAAVDKVRDDLMKNNQNDYVIPVKNMGHNLKQVVRDNAAYGLAAFITHRMLILVAERLRQFEGKVYNVRVERMMNDCLAAAIEQSVDADIKIRAYIDRSHYSWQKVVFHHILPGMYDTVNISFNFDVNELTQGQKRIVTGRDMEKFIEGIFNDMVRLDTKLQEIEDSNYRLCNSDYVCAYFAQAVKVEEQVESLKQGLKNLTGAQYYRFDYNHTTVSTLPSYRA
jgi:hypothetical protein